jgi:hypothetical protein
VAPLGARAISDGRVGALEAAAVSELDEALALAARQGATPEAAHTAARLVVALRGPSPARDAVLTRHIGVPDRALGLAILERLAEARRDSAAARASLDLVVGEDINHARRVLAALADLEEAGEIDPDGAVATALHDELSLLRRRLAAALAARYGRDELGAALRRLDDEAASALAAEALEVTLGRERASQVVAVLAPGLGTAERLARLGGPPAGRADPNGSDGVGARAREWLLDIAADIDAVWRSGWLRACAIRALRLTAAAEPATLASLAPELEQADPVVAEELTLVRKELRPA